jgi:hypothetical protein
MTSVLRTHACAYLVGVAALVAAGCDSNPADAPAGPSAVREATTTAPASSAPANPHGANPHGTMMGAPPQKKAAVSWTAPQAWSKVDHPSPMRIATYKVAKADGDPDDAELSITQVGGDVASNIERWKGQFEGGPTPKTEERTVGDLKVTLVFVEGTYKGMSMPAAGPADPKKDWALLGAVVEWPGHGDNYFFKMTGPKKTVDGARAGFDELLGSLAHE